MLKQPLCSPLSLHEQVITLCAATHKVMQDIELKKIKAFQQGMLDYFDTTYPEIGRQIETERALSEELEEQILKIAREYKSRNR